MGEERKILLIGATGLVGNAVVLAAGVHPLSVLSRRTLPRQYSPTVKVHIAGAEDWPQRIKAIRPDVLICCIGTTLRNVKGSHVAFRSVDQHLVLACGHAAKDAGTAHMICLTSVGANSRVDNLYLNAKGMAEDGLTALDFDRLDLVRPGLLIGARTELRPAEALFQKLAPVTDALLHGGLRKYRSITGEVVARAMWRLALAGGSGRHVHHHDEITALAE
jgi:uncharacterized protein YbjT (DUF2867 family)